MRDMRFDILSQFILRLRRQRYWKKRKPNPKENNWGAEFDPSFCGLETLLKLHA